MAYQHRNRCGHVYVQAAEQCAREASLSFWGRRRTGEPVDDVPAAYEVYESPRHGQVATCARNC